MEEKLTPMMAQYKSLKEVAKEALLLFRMGDFYEAFYEDAHLLADVGQVTLTKRSEVPMSGVPWHSVETYIDRLLAKGIRVAIADQVESSQESKGLVKRAIVRTITPGTTTSDQFINAKQNHYIAALSRVGALFGLSFCDVTTGEFKVIELEDQAKLLNELMRLKPAEIITYSQFRDKHDSLFQNLRERWNPTISICSSYNFEHKSAYKICIDHFHVQQLDGFGLKGMVAAINSAGGLICYLKEELNLPLAHLRSIGCYMPHNGLRIDSTTEQHLELLESPGRPSKKSLLALIDQTSTPMGARILRNWLKQPLLDPEEIATRQEGIETLSLQPTLLTKLENSLNKVKDLERLMMKVMSNWATPQDLVSIGCSLKQLPLLKKALISQKPEILVTVYQELLDLSGLSQKIEESLVQEPALKIGEGPVFSKGFCKELDQLMEAHERSQEYLAHYQTELKETLNIKTLKIGYNKIYGYYFEVSRKESLSLEKDFEKKQTLVNCVRFTSDKLKNFEHELLMAEEKKILMEKELFESLTKTVQHHFEQLLWVSRAVATLDALTSLAQIGRKKGWVRPRVDKSQLLEIVDGRHPIVEANSSEFIPNDTCLDHQNARLMLITGPNMAGKSTYIRQVALIVILAQMGSLVPAKRAHIGVVDQIFTRIGANDDLSRGQSTFMVEMTETAAILNQATDRSLVILDEIGRGTSTYDGLAIAWSVVEYLLLTLGKQAKTLFATHYFELTELASLYPSVINTYAMVQENFDKITFLYKIGYGCAEKSYGIHVAKLAQMPSEVTRRAEEILQELQSKNPKQKFIPKVKKAKEQQLLLFK